MATHNPRALWPGLVNHLPHNVDSRWHGPRDPAFEKRQINRRLRKAARLDPEGAPLKGKWP